MSAAPKRPSRIDPTPIDFGAVENLRYIRSTIEAAHTFTTVPGKGCIAMGITVMAMVFITDWRAAVPLMILIGAMAGYFVVPMNALLQHRGHLLMGAGHSIAVQNFNENLSILAMLGAYALMIKANLGINAIVIIFGLFVALTMTWLTKKHGHDQDHAET